MTEDQQERRASVWRNRSYVRLWIGESVSLFGSYITYLAFPLTAILVLHASATQIGLINGARFLPGLVVPLVAGVMMDRRPRKPVLMATRLSSCVTLCAVPAAAALHVLSIGAMCALAFLVGALSVVDQIANQTLVPSVVAAEDLVQANSGLVASESVASVGVPGIAGVLVSLLTAPIALLIDAASFLVSTAMLSRIRIAEPAPAPRPAGQNMFRQIRRGIRITLGNRILITLVGWSAVYNFFDSAIMTLLILYLVKGISLSPSGVGTVYALGGLGPLLGAMAARRAGERFGLGPTLVGAMVTASSPYLLLLFVHGQLSGVVLSVAAIFLNGLGVTASNIHSVSLRQNMIPSDSLGTVFGAIRFLIAGVIPMGSLLGGVLGSQLGLRPALVVCAVGTVAACAWPLVFGLVRVRSVEDVPLVQVPG